MVWLFNHMLGDYIKVGDLVELVALNLKNNNFILGVVVIKGKHSCKIKWLCNNTNYFLFVDQPIENLKKIQ